MRVGAGQCGCSTWGHKVRGKEDREWKESSVTGLRGLRLPEVNRFSGIRARSHLMRGFKFSHVSCYLGVSEGFPPTVPHLKA